MIFFDAFSALGYSAINLLLVFVAAGAVLFRLLGLQRRHVAVQAVYGLIVLALFVPSVIFLAGQNRMLNDAIRAEGGLQRIETPSQTD